MYTMKIKMFFSILSASVIAILIAQGIVTRDNLSTLTMENVEALTFGEDSESSGKSKICYTYVMYDENDSRLSTTWYCGDCTEIPYTTRSDQRLCKEH